MNSIVIIGAGRLGATIGFALSQRGYTIEAVSCSRASSAEESSRIIGQGAFSTDNVQTAKLGDIVILSVPDDDIETVATELADTNINWKEKTVFHCSGLLPSEALLALKSRGALTASLHPVQTFPKKERNSGLFQEIYFGLEGDKTAVETAKTVVRALGGKHIILDAKDKPLFHAACSVASSHLAALLNMSSSLLVKMGLDEKTAIEIIFPLIQRTLHNVKNIGVSSALTGPVIRGDQKTLLSHLESLKESPRHSDAYISLARMVLEIAEKETRLSPEKIKILKGLLEDK